MSVELATAYVSIIPSMRGVSARIAAGLGDPTRMGKRHGKKFGGSFANAVTRITGRALAYGSGAALLGIGALTTGAVKKFAQLEDATDAVRTTFGKGFADVQKFSKDAGEQFGLTQTQALEAAFEIGVFGRQAGKSGKGLGKFSTDLVGVAGDLASMKGVRPEEALTALTSAMAGESEAIRRFGVDISAQTLKQRALETGLIKTSRPLTQQERIIMSYREIMRQTTLQQGDFVRTSDATANVNQRLKIAFENLQTSLGAKLAPTVVKIQLKLMHFINSVTKNLPKILETIGNVWNAFKKWIPVLKVVIPLLGALWAGFKVQQGILAASAFLKGFALYVTLTRRFGAAAVVAAIGQRIFNNAIKANIIMIVVAAIIALIGAVVWLYNNNETARKIIDGAWKGIKAAVKATVDWITNTAVPFLKKAWDVIKIGARNVANFFMTYLWPGIKFVIDLIVGYYKFLWNVAKVVFQGVIVAIRKFVNFFKGVWKVIKTVWQYIVGAFKAAFNVVSTIFRVIGKVARAFAILFMKYVWPHIRKVLNWIADKFKWWWGVIKTAWKIIKNVVIKPVVAWFQKYVWGTFKKVLNWLADKFRTFVKGLKIIWKFLKENVIRPVVKWFRHYVWGTIRKVINWIRDKFEKFKRGLKIIWNAIKKNIIRPVVVWIYNNVVIRIRKAIALIRFAFNKLKDRLKAIWDNIKKRIIRPVVDWFRDSVVRRIKRALNLMKEAFRIAKDKIGKVWDDLKRKVAKPINFVIKLYNTGIRSVWNPVAKQVGLPKLDRVDPVKFSSGGYTGPGAKYQPAGIVHAGEYVIRKEAVNRLPRPFLDDLNRGYASGGLVKAARWWIDKGARASEHPAFGGVRYRHMPNSKHYSGNAVDLNFGVTGPGEMAFFDKFLPAFRNAFKNIGVIWRSSGHFDHMHIENGGVNNIGGGVGGAGLMDLLTKPINLVKNMIKKIPGKGGFTDMMKAMVRKLLSATKEKLIEKVPFLGDLGEGIVGASSAIKGKVQNIASKFGWAKGKAWNAIDWLVSKESSWRPWIQNPTSSAKGLFQQMQSLHGPVSSNVGDQAKWGLKYIAERYGSPMKAVRHHMANGWYANGGLVRDAGVFDSGGVLPPGRSVVDNRTGRPEPLYTQDQLNSAGRGPTVGTMVVADPRAAVRELEAMERRAAVRANVRGIR